MNFNYFLILYFLTLLLQSKAIQLNSTSKDDVKNIYENFHDNDLDFHQMENSEIISIADKIDVNDINGLIINENNNNNKNNDVDKKSTEKTNLKLVKQTTESSSIQITNSLINNDDEDVVDAMADGKEDFKLLKAYKLISKYPDVPPQKHYLPINILITPYEYLKKLKNKNLVDVNIDNKSQYFKYGNNNNNNNDINYNFNDYIKKTSDKINDVKYEIEMANAEISKLIDGKLEFSTIQNINYHLLSTSTSSTINNDDFYFEDGNINIENNQHYDDIIIDKNILETTTLNEDPAEEISTIIPTEFIKTTNRIPPVTPIKSPFISTEMENIPSTTNTDDKLIMSSSMNDLPEESTKTLNNILETSTEKSKIINNEFESFEKSFARRETFLKEKQLKRNIFDLILPKQSIIHAYPAKNKRNHTKRYIVAPSPMNNNNIRKPKFVEKLENETSLERAERQQKNLQKFMQFVGVVGQVDSYLTKKVRKGFKKFSQIIDSDEQLMETRRRKRKLPAL